MRAFRGVRSAWPFLAFPSQGMARQPGRCEAPTMVQIVPLVARPEGSPQARRPCEALFRPTHHLAPARRTGMEAYHQPIQRVMHYGALKAVGSLLGEKLPGKKRPDAAVNSSPARFGRGTRLCRRGPRSGGGVSRYREGDTPPSGLRPVQGRHGSPLNSSCRGGWSENDQKRPLMETGLISSSRQVRPDYVCCSRRFVSD